MLEVSYWELGIVPSVFFAELLARWLRLRPWFGVGVPLDQELVPLPGLPEGAGHTSTVSWEIDETTARWWAHRGGTWGLHGQVVFHPRSGRMQLHISWAPPWTAIVAIVWGSALGARHGIGPISSLGCTLMMLMLLAGYRQAALRAVAELRWAWTQALEEADD